jgi:anti-sigma factor RsiW
VTHEEARALIPAHALDALEPEEARAVEAHLAICDECRRQLTDLRDATSLLAAGAPDVAPPPALRRRVLAAAEAPGRRATGPPSGSLGWVAAAVIVVLLGGLSVWLARRVASAERQLAAQTRLLILLASPSAKTVELSGTAPGSVRLVWDPVRRQGALVATGLRNPGQRSVYQVWLISYPRPQSAGVFRPASGRATIAIISADVSRYHAVAISLEPGPAGSPQPTTKPIFTGAIFRPGR